MTFSSCSCLITELESVHFLSFTKSPRFSNHYFLNTYYVSFPFSSFSGIPITCILYLLVFSNKFLMHFSLKKTPPLSFFRLDNLYWFIFKFVLSSFISILQLRPHRRFLKFKMLMFSVLEFSFVSFLYSLFLCWDCLHFNWLSLLPTEGNYKLL